MPTYADIFITPTCDSTDFSTMLKLMRKLGGVVITTKNSDNYQGIYVVGARETVVYKFYEHKLFDRAVKPYGFKPTMCVDSMDNLIAQLCECKHCTITIYNERI